MPIPVRERIACDVDERFAYLKTDDGSLTLESLHTGDTFHSGCGAVAECNSVYVVNSGIAESLQRRIPQRVLELGFGTGLAFLVTASFAERTGTALIYRAIEKELLNPQILCAVLEGSRGVSPIDDGVLDAFLASVRQLEKSTQSDNTQHVVQVGDHCELLIIREDVVDFAERTFARLTVPTAEIPYDAVYFDPFDPVSNKEAWSEPILQWMYSMLRPGGRLTSYCVKSEIRHRLLKIGFAVSRVPGPVGGKREVLVATRPL